ncbi:hypothetical protein [Streptomyces sp. NPDC005009]
MTDHHTYGTSTHTAGELVRLVSDRLGLVFTERDSYYRGVYHLAGIPNGRIRIQPNPIPFWIVLDTGWSKSSAGHRRD